MRVRARLRDGATRISSARAPERSSPTAKMGKSHRLKRASEGEGASFFATLYHVQAGGSRPGLPDLASV